MTHFIYEESLHGTNVNDDLDNMKVTPSALSSLRIALRSFFETYRVATRYIFFENLDTNSDYIGQEEYLCQSISYQEKYFQTIFHFHHFFELLFKDVLRSIDPELAVKTTTNRMSIEFSETLKRIRPHSFVVDTNYDTFDLLNTLRNRGWHRGTWLLKYTALELFVGRELIPLTLECLATSPYHKTEHQWKYEPPFVGSDPINSLIEETQRNEVDFRKTAFYKAMGAACCNLKWDVKQDKAHLGQHPHIDRAKQCFICSNQTLVSYDYMVLCHNCGFQIRNDLGNPREYGINVDDFWR